MSTYNKKDAAKDSGSGTKEVSRAWHAARDDAAKEGQLSERNQQKTSDSPEGKVLYKIFKKAGMTK